MNDWYIDRSKNFVNETLNPVICFMGQYEGPMESNAVISSLIKNDIFDDDQGNLNAALTRFRDHGILNNKNQLGDSARDYYLGRLSLGELIIDLLMKRPAAKKNSFNIKPLVLMCRAFDIMHDIVPDENEIYLSVEECYKFLIGCTDITNISVEYVDSILENRLCKSSGCKLKQNDITNLSIWFNALNHTPIFESTNCRTIIKPNVYTKSFFNFIAINGIKMSETPTDSNTNLYNYYCRRETGISEIIENVFKPNIVVNDEKMLKKLVQYLFGVNKYPDINYTDYFVRECFGVYNPFIFIPGLVYRKIWTENVIIGNALFDFCGKGIV